MTRAEFVPHPVFQGKTIRLPSPGKLKWLGGNMGFDMPISEDVIDDKGNLLSIGMEEVLSSLNDFEGYRGDVPIAENLLYRAFSAYELELMTQEEKLFFENYVTEKAKGLNPFEMIKNAMLSAPHTGQQKLLEG